MINIYIQSSKPADMFKYIQQLYGHFVVYVNSFHHQFNHQNQDTYTSGAQVIDLIIISDSERAHAIGTMSMNVSFKSIGGKIFDSLFAFNEN